MTDLTEQWKKGELPDGTYYVKLNWDNIITTLFYSLANGFENDDHFYDEDEIKEVLSEVPSYEELQNINKSVNDLMASNIKLVEENTKLKELLKECRSPINYALCLNLSKEEKIEFKNLLTKINQALGEDK